MESQDKNIIPTKDTAFDALVERHTILSAIDGTGDSTSSISTEAKIRSATEAGPLESMEAIARLLSLESEETSQQKERTAEDPMPWFKLDLGSILKNTMTTTAIALSEVWTLKFKSPTELVYDLIAIAVKDNRLPYLLMFCIITLLLIRPALTPRHVA